MESLQILLSTGKLHEVANGVQVSNGVLHGVLHGEVHEECRVYAVVDGAVAKGAQDGMPGCKIGCRIGPNPRIRCKLASGQDANKGVLDGVLTSVSHFILRFQFIHFEHL